MDTQIEPGEADPTIIGPNGRKFQNKIVNIFLSISFNICFGCSKELSH